MGMDKLVEYLEGLAENTATAAALGLEKGMKRTVEAAKSRAPVGDGQLRNSITSYVEVDGDTIEGTILAGAEHAVYVEMGTGSVGEASHAGISPAANPIYATGRRKLMRKGRSGKIVAWETDGWVYKNPKTGEFVFTRGQPAKPYMYPAYKETQGLIKSDMQQAINEKLGGE